MTAILFMFFGFHAIKDLKKKYLALSVFQKPFVRTNFDIFEQ